MLKYYLELNNLENKFDLNNFGYLKFILRLDNMLNILQTNKILHRINDFDCSALN